MSRAIFLPTPGDPILCHLWLHLYKKNVKDHVDSLYIHINSVLPPHITYYPATIFSEITTKIYLEPRMIGHGQALKVLFNVSDEDLIMLMEDDCFIFDRNIVDTMFRGIEKNEYDLAGSPRMSCSVETAEAAAKRWNLDYSGIGDKGCNFWPNCLFVKRKDLLKTDLDFSNHGWKAGEYVPYLDHTMKEDAAGDTLVHLSLQLRNLGLRIKEIPQYHGSPYELENLQNGAGIFDGHAPWTHSGSSSDVQKMLVEHTLPNPITDMEKMELERRYAWWIMAYDEFAHKIQNPLVKNYADDSMSYLNKVIKLTGLSVRNISTLVNAYRRFL